MFSYNYKQNHDPMFLNYQVLASELRKVNKIVFSFKITLSQKLDKHSLKSLQTTIYFRCEIFNEHYE